MLQLCKNKNVENALWLLFLKMVKSGYQITDPATDIDYTYWRRGTGKVTLKHFPVLRYKTAHILTPLESQVPLLDMLLLLCPQQTQLWITQVSHIVCATCVYVISCPCTCTRPDLTPLGENLTHYEMKCHSSGGGDLERCVARQAYQYLLITQMGYQIQIFQSIHN